VKIKKGSAKNMELVSYHDLEGRPAFKIAMQVVDGKWYLYLGHFWHYGWTILDVTDPFEPKLANFIKGPDLTETHQIQAADGILITPMQKLMPFRGNKSSDLEGFYIWDLKDPTNPKRLGHWESGTFLGCHRCHYEGGRYVHATAGAPGFDGRIYRIIDIIDPSKPVEVGRWWVPEQWSAGRIPKEDQLGLAGPPYPIADHDQKFSLHGPAYTKGDRAYLNFYNSGLLVILDISDIALPKMVGQLRFNPPFGNAIAGHTARPLTNKDFVLYTTEGTGPSDEGALNCTGIVDVSDERNPMLISLFPVPEPPPGSPYKNFCEKGGSFGPHNFNHPQNQPYYEDRDDRVYLTYFNAGIRVYDISDPYLPKEIAYYIPPNPTEARAPEPFNKGVVSSEDVVVDTRGYIYMSDKNWGIHILRCTI